MAGPAVTSGTERAGPLAGRVLPLACDSATVAFASVILWAFSLSSFSVRKTRLSASSRRSTDTCRFRSARRWASAKMVMPARGPTSEPPMAAGRHDLLPDRMDSASVESSRKSTPLWANDSLSFLVGSRRGKRKEGWDLRPHQPGP
jgi:hypothetical protein